MLPLQAIVVAAFTPPTNDASMSSDWPQLARAPSAVGARRRARRRWRAHLSPAPNTPSPNLKITVSLTAAGSDAIADARLSHGCAGARRRRRAIGARTRARARARTPRCRPGRRSCVCVNFAAPPPRAGACRVPQQATLFALGDARFADVEFDDSSIVASGNLTVVDCAFGAGNATSQVAAIKGDKADVNVTRTGAARRAPAYKVADLIATVADVRLVGVRAGARHVARLSPRPVPRARRRRRRRRRHRSRMRATRTRSARQRTGDPRFVGRVVGRLRRTPGRRH